jgi:hypothetical protein
MSFALSWSNRADEGVEVCLGQGARSDEAIVSSRASKRLAISHLFLSDFAKPIYGSRVSLVRCYINEQGLASLRVQNDQKPR